MTIYFQGNEKEDFQNWTFVNGLTYVNDTGTPWNRSYVRSSMRFGWSDYTETDTFSANDFWTHAFIGLSFGTYSQLYPILGFYSGSQAYLGVWYSSAITGLEGKYWNGTSWTTLWQYPNISLTRSYDWDVYIKVGGSGTGQFKLYVNNQVAGSATLDTTFGGAVSNFTKVRISAGNANTAGLMYFSEVIVADFVTLGSRLMTIYPNAAGTYAEFNTAYTAIDEQAPGGDLSSSGTANQRLSANFLDVSALSSGETIVNVKALGYMSRDTTGPTNMNFFTRISATDYHSADQGVTLLLTDFPHPVQNWTVSPATSSAWTVTELNGAEFGIRSRT